MSTRAWAIGHMQPLHRSRASSMVGWVGLPQLRVRWLRFQLSLAKLHPLDVSVPRVVLVCVGHRVAAPLARHQHAMLVQLSVVRLVCGGG